jgi:Phosphotransferase enzyme family
MNGRRIGELIGRGNVADVYAFGDAVLKLYRDDRDKLSAFREADNLAIIEGLGLPAPVVHEVGQFEERWGMVMSRASGSPPTPDILNDKNSSLSLFSELAVLQSKLLQVDAPALPDLKVRLAGRIRSGVGLGEASKTGLLDLLVSMPAGHRVCHGDFHPFNVLGRGANAVVIDWLDAAAGDPAADVCRSFVLLHPHAPDLARHYINLHARNGGPAPHEVAQWLPIVAAARMSENTSGELPQLHRWAEGEPADFSC